MQQLSFLPGEMTPGERSLIQRALKSAASFNGP